MKYWIILLLLFSLQSCWLCPDSHTIEYDSQSRKFKVLSEGYHLKSIKITKYNLEDGFINHNDSNCTDIIVKNEFKTIVALTNIKGNYIEKGENLQSMLANKNLEFFILIAKDKDTSDVDGITFRSSDLEKGKNVFKSRGGCK
jgi:hypothetical protein